MPFVKYNVKDNSRGQLAIWISADTNVTEIALNTWEWALFWVNQIIKLVEYTTPWDETSPEVWFENMLITWITWDTLTITREFAGTTARTFPTSSYAYWVIHSYTTKDIQDEVTRLEADKLDNNELRTWLTSNRLLSSNNSWVEEAWISFWTAWQVLTSTWTTTQPIFGDVPEQTVFSKTTITTLDGAADYVMVSDWSSSNTNRKILINKFLNAELATPNYIAAYSALTERSQYWTTPTIKKRFFLPATYWTVRLIFEMRSDTGAYDAYARVYLNWVLIATEVTGSTAYQQKEVLIDVSWGSIIHIDLRSQNTYWTAYIRNVTLNYESTPINFKQSVLLD